MHIPSTRHWHAEFRFWISLCKILHMGILGKSCSPLANPHIWTEDVNAQVEKLKNGVK